MIRRSSPQSRLDDVAFPERVNPCRRGKTKRGGHEECGTARSSVAEDFAAIDAASARREVADARTIQISVPSITHIDSGKLHGRVNP